MGSEQLRAVLKSWPLPDASAARARTIAVAQATARERYSKRRPLAQRLALATVSVALLVALATVTVPGRAVADWIGGLFGIGEVGGPPTLTTHLDVAGEPPAEAPIIVAAGESPSGLGYELVAYRSISGSACLALEFPKEREEATSGLCPLNAGGGEGLYVPTLAFPEDRETYFLATSTAPLARAELLGVSAEPIPLPVTAPVPYLDRVGVEKPIAALIAFLPVGVTQAKIDSGELKPRVLGYNAEGQRLFDVELGHALGPN